MIKESMGRKAFNWFNIIFMLLLVLVTIYPFLYILFASFSEPSRVIAHQGVLWHTLGFSTVSYKLALEHPLLVPGYLNTLYILVVGTTINVCLTALGAYFLSRKNVKFQKPIALLIVFTMFFSGGLIPFYLTVKEIAFIYDSKWALIIPTAINTFNMIVMRTGFAAIPDAIEESATIDGAGHFMILFRFILPLSLPTVAVIILYYGVAHWNAWFNASIFLRKATDYPLQLVLRQILMANSMDDITLGIDAGEKMAISETIKYAVIVIATLPILCIYPFMQKYFVKGVMVGAVKG